MIVVYRITSIPSTNPSPVFQDDKNKLNELCLKSFNKAFHNVKPKVIFLADFVEDFDFSICEFDYEVVESQSGINETMLKAYAIAQDYDDYILFAECDYLYREDIGTKYLNALQELDIVSPYDHLNFYLDKNLHSEFCKIKLIDGYHYRSTERNTMTWGCHSSIIKENYEIFKKYGYLDGDVWYELRDRGRKMWVPIPSMATHMVKDFLAPSIYWESIWLRILSEDYGRH